MAGTVIFGHMARVEPHGPSGRSGAMRLLWVVRSGRSLRAKPRVAAGVMKGPRASIRWRRGSDVMVTLASDVAFAGEFRRTSPRGVRQGGRGEITIDTTETRQS